MPASCAVAMPVDSSSPDVTTTALIRMFSLQQVGADGA
jgi:hypothetical protein